MSNLIHERMAKVMSEIGSIGKDQKNTAQGFKFRGIDQFINALHPLLVKNKIYVSPKVLEFKQELKDVIRRDGKAGVDKHVALLVQYTFTTDDGSSTVIGPIAAEGVDSGDKATNKALSAGLKYSLIQTFFVPTEDMAEADFDSPELGTSAKQLAQGSFGALKAEKEPAKAVPAASALQNGTLEGGSANNLPPVAKTEAAPARRAAFKTPANKQQTNGHATNGKAASTTEESDF